MVYEPDRAGRYFVTRLKENADYGVVEKREIPQRRGVLRDEVVYFTTVRLSNSHNDVTACNSSA
jgi:hypothetical protein